MKRLALSLSASLAILISGCNSGSTPSAQQPAKSAPAEAAKSPETQAKAATPPSAAKAPAAKLTKLEIKDNKVGKGKAAAMGDTLYVAYVGKLADGKVFDNSDDHSSDFPFMVVLGKGQVIPGWEQGLVGMKVGGERDLGIPSSLGYGPTGAGNGVIPPDADLFFHIKLLDMIRKGEEDIVDVKDVKKGTGRVAKKGDTATVHYVGTSVTGKKFDSSRDRGTPISFKIGQHEVVSGFETGIEGMRVGGVRRLHIPPQVGYGKASMGKIPPYSILIFEVELLSLK